MGKNKTVGSAHTRELFEKSSTKNFYPKTALCAVFMVLFLLVACGGNGNGNGNEAEVTPSPEPPPVLVEEIEIEIEPEEIKPEEIEAEEIETEEIEPEEIETEEIEMEVYEVILDSYLPLLAEQAISRTWERLYIPEGEAGAFDVGVDFSMERGGENLVSFELGLKVESDGYRVETMVETTMDMSAMMGAFFDGVDMHIAVFTATEGGEAVESRLYMGGTEMNMALFGGFDPAELVQIGEYSLGTIIGSMFEFLPQFTAEELEDIEIRYDRVGDYWTLWLSGIYIPMDFELAQSTMAAFGVDMQGVSVGEVLLAFDSYVHYPPHRIVAEIHWQIDDVEYFIIFRVGIH